MEEKGFNLTQGMALLLLKPLNLPANYVLNLIIFKRETSLGLETYEELGFNSEEDLELEISKLTEFTPEFKNNLK